MEFRITVRDNNGTAGCTEEDNMVVTTVDGIGPFVVTAPNTVGVTWTEGQSAAVTWNVANTTSAPVSCSTVDIFLSYDGGFTYPVQLANNTTNSGSAIVTVPAGTTTTARVMVKAEGNIFFDISNFNFSIIAGAAPDFTMGTTQSSRVFVLPTMPFLLFKQAQLVVFQEISRFPAAGLRPEFL